MFNDLKTDDTVVSDGDSIGGKFNTLDSSLYECTIKLAYGSISKGGARALNLVLETAENKELKRPLWVTSGKAKGCLNYYVNSKTKVKKYLPGYESANDLCLMTLNKRLNQTSTESKHIMLYDFAQGKEVATEVKMITDLIGKKIIAGVIKQTTDKNIKDEASGEYVPSGETREENEIDKFFHFPTGLTVTEATAKMTEPKFKNTWAKTWNGVARDKTTKTGIALGAPSAPGRPTAPAQTGSLFG